MIIIYKLVRIQEQCDAIDNQDATSFVSFLNCELRDDLIDSIIIGKLYSVSGIIREKILSKENIPCDMNNIKMANPYFYIEVNFLMEVEKNFHCENKLDNNDLKAIINFASSGNVFQNLINSFCPFLSGYQVAKGII